MGISFCLFGKRSPRNPKGMFVFVDEMQVRKKEEKQKTKKKTSK
jgi:hypothetical protein